MIEKFCNYLTNKIRKNMPEVTDERAEVINYGLQLVIGEVPKTFIMLLIAYLLGVLELSILAFFMIMPYRSFAGGFHLKTHIGCIVGTTLFYCGNAMLSQSIIIESVLVKVTLIFAIWVFSMWMIKLYAPADTENVPIISKKDRKFKKIMSYDNYINSKFICKKYSYIKHVNIWSFNTNSSNNQIYVHNYKK